MKNAVIVGVLLLTALLGPVGTGLAQKLDLARPEDNLKAFIKMRASLVEGEETVYYWKGRIYSYLPAERSVPLFDLEAYNIARVVKVDGGYQMLTREVAVYRDLKTGKILERWYNPLIKDSVDVVQVWNDPVNQDLLLKGRFGEWGVPWQPLGPGRVVMNSDIFLTYPSPLKKADFPDNSRSDTYQAAELFQFFIDEKDLTDPKKTNVYSEVSWARISDFLPWMRMADRPGSLVYHCRGSKLMGKGISPSGSFELLPADLKAYVRKNQPVFTTAPLTKERDNMTSWKYFYQLKTKK